MKRLFDIVVSAAGLLAFSPIALLIAIAIKLDDGGPVFFSQDRVGLGGCVFPAFKFRSMVVDAERATGAIQAVDNDPRVTRVGRVLRATAFDLYEDEFTALLDLELPQCEALLFRAVETIPFFVVRDAERNAFLVVGPAVVGAG